MSTVIGELREAMEKDLKRGLEAIVMNRKKEKEVYYILCHASWAGDNQIKTKFVILKEKPKPLLGTLLYRVDNKKGQIFREWALPLDNVSLLRELQEEQPIEEIGKSALKIKEDIIHA
jgi:hypothetical protein